MVDKLKDGFPRKTSIDDVLTFGNQRMHDDNLAKLELRKTKAINQFTDNLKELQELGFSADELIVLVNAYVKG